MYTIGTMELLNEATKERLVKYAKTFDDLKQFIDNVGYEEWQDDFIENSGAEELTEADTKRIDNVLTEIYNEAHKIHKVIEEWEQIGGLLNSYGTGSLFIESEEVYKEWLKENNLKDTEEAQKTYCRLALKECGEFTDNDIEKLLEW